MRWRLFIEEYSPDLRYIKGETNVVADALSRLPTEFETMPECHFTEELRSQLYCLGQDKMDETAYPLTYKAIGQAQQKDTDLHTKVLSKKGYSVKTFGRAEKQWELITYHDKIVIAKDQQQEVIDLYHSFLSHPGMNRTLATISQHLYWTAMKEQIIKTVSGCLNCNRNKKRSRKLGHLPEKESEAQP